VFEWFYRVRSLKWGVLESFTYFFYINLSWFRRFNVAYSTFPPDCNTWLSVTHLFYVVLVHFNAFELFLLHSSRAIPVDGWGIFTKVFKVDQITTYFANIDIIGIIALIKAGKQFTFLDVIVFILWNFSYLLNFWLILLKIFNFFNSECLLRF